MFPTLRGDSPSWADLNVTNDVIGGLIASITDLSALNWETKVEVGEQRGLSGGRVVSRTSGSRSDTADAEFYRSGLDALIAQLITVAPLDPQGRPKLSKVPFNLIVSYSTFGSDAIKVVQLKGCRLLKMGGKHSEGTDPDKVSVDLNPIEISITVNGREAVLL